MKNIIESVPSQPITFEQANINKGIVIRCKSEPSLVGLVVREYTQCKIVYNTGDYSDTYSSVILLLKALIDHVNGYYAIQLED